MLTEKQLLELKKKVDEAKTKSTELTGQKNALIKQLKKDWGCDSIEEAEKKMKKFEKQIESIDEQIEKGIEEIEEKYELEK